MVGPNGRVYDYLRLTGNQAQISADVGQVARINFLDLQGDLVSVEIEGAGALTVTLDSWTGPVAAELYYLPVQYMLGHATLTVTGADASTNLCVFATGRLTAVNQQIFRQDVTYDGIADIARLSIVGVGPTQCGAIRTANVRYTAKAGVTGITATEVAVIGPVHVGDIAASDSATPALQFGSVSAVYVCGGDLAQPNGKLIQVRGFSSATDLVFMASTDAHGTVLPVQVNAGQYSDGPVPPVFTTHPSSRSVTIGSATSLAVAASDATTFGWQHNGHDLIGATSSTVTISDAQPAAAGIYQALAINGPHSTYSRPAILGLTTTNKVVGAGTETAVNVVHPAGYVFDQVLGTGPALSVTADAEQVTRLSFIDLDDDIVQVELSGPGTLSVVLDDATAPGPPAKYNQPSVNYVKGHAGLVIAGANEHTHLSITSVGRVNTFDPTGRFVMLAPISATNDPANNGSPLYSGHSTTVYDGIADIAFIAILSSNGKFGRLDAGNADCSATRGITGIFAPGVAFTGPVLIGDVSAFETAMPALVLGSVGELRVVGGSLEQPNTRPLEVSGLTAASVVQFVAGIDSHGNPISAKTNQTRFQSYGVAEQPPAIISAATTTFTVGSAGTFNVQAIGTPAPSITVASGSLPSWATLSETGVISGTPANADGSPFAFTLQAANGVGAASSQTFTLTVVEPLTVEPLADQTVTAGNSVTFSATTTGGSTLTYQWRRDGAPISGATSASYSISSVTMLDAGTYDVVVTRAAEQVVSSAANLAVAPTSYPGTMRVDPTFRPMIEKAGADIYALARQPDGKLIAAGDFSRVSGVLRPSLARVEATGAVDLAFDPGKGVNGLIRRMALLADGRIIIAGDFTSYDGVPRNHVAMINADGTLDRSFEPGAGPDGQVLALAVQSDGKVLLGGSFSSYDGVARPRIVRLNAAGSVDATFDPGSGPDDSVVALTVQTDDRIIIAGRFGWYDGSHHARVARLNPDGSIDGSFVFAAEGADNPTSLALQPDGKILLGGSNFDNPQTNLQRLCVDGARDVSFVSGPANPTLAVTIQPDGKILVGTGVDPASGVPRRCVTRFNPDGTQDSSFAASATVEGGVQALVLAPDGYVVFGGTDVLSASGGERIYRLGASGATDPSFDARLRSLAVVHDVAAERDGKLIVGGEFEYVDNVASNRIARLNADGTRDNTFRAGAGADGIVESVLLQPDGRVLAAGQFTHIDGKARKFLARLDASGTVDPSFDPGAGPNNQIRALVLQPDGRLVIGGYFANYGGTYQPYIARIEPNGTLDADFRPDVGWNGFVECLALQRDGKITLGGHFTTINGVSRARVARLNSDGSLDAGFRSGLEAERHVSGTWSQPNGKLLINPDGGETLVRLQLSGALDTSFTTGNLSPLYVIGVQSVLVQADGKVLAGRAINSSTDSDPAPVGLVRLRANGSVDPDFSVPGLRDAKISRIIMLDDGEILVAGTRFSDGKVDQGGVARLTRAIAPAFTSPDHGSFALGTANTLTVTASGAPSPQFCVSGGNFPPWAHLDSVTGAITGTPLDAVGSPFTFVLEATNGVGSAATQTFTLAVVNGAIAIAPLESRGATAGGSVTWTASVSGETPASYQWRWNGQPIAGATSASYTIPTATFHDAGRYDVVVRSASGQVFTSAAGRLEVAPTRYPGAMQLDPTFAPLIEAAGGTIWNIARQPDGKLVVGGSFSRINGVLRRNVARLNADGSVDATFDPGLGPDQPVYKVAVQPDGKILLGGEFLQYDGVASGRIVRVNGDGSLDDSFATGAGSDGRIEAIALQADGRILVGGWFDHFDGANRGGFVRLNVDGSLDTAFTVGTASGVMDAVVLSDGRILLAGPFARFGEVIRKGVVRLGADGTIDPDFVPETWDGFDATCLAVQPDGKIVVGASSFEQNGPDLLRLNPDGSRDNGFTPPSIRRIDAVTLQPNGQILIGGMFRNNGAARYQIARLQTDGSIDGSFNSAGSLDFDIESIVLLPSGELVVGGRSLRFEGTHNAIGRLKPTGVLDASFGGEARSPGEVESFIRQRDGTLLIGGVFHYVNGTTRRQFARLRADGTLHSDATSTLVHGGTTGSVASVSAMISQPDRKTVLTGSFIRVDGVLRNGIARLSEDGTVDPSFNPGSGPNFWIAAAALQPDGKILLGGIFSSYGGVTRNTLARINPDGSLDLTFDPGAGANWHVSAVALQPDGRVLACGAFSSFAGVSRKGVVRVNRDGSLDTAFGAIAGLTTTAESILVNPDGTLSVGRWNGITRLTTSGSVDPSYTSTDLSDVGNIGTIHRQADGRLIVGQDINSGASRPTIGIARVNADGTRDSSFGVMGLHEAHVSAIEILEDGRMLVAGTTFNDGTFEQYGLARLVFVPAPAITQQPSAQTANVGQTVSLSVVADGEGPFTYQWRKAGAPITDNVSASTATLTLVNAQLGDAGAYDVVVTNVGGSTTSDSATVAVYLPPQITVQPADQTITAGEGAVFSVVVTASPAPTYQWRRNGVALPGATSASLTLSTVPANGGGTITVVVANPGGTVESDAATLTVNPLAPVFSPAVPARATAIQGRSFFFPVAFNNTPASFTATGLGAVGETLVVNPANGTVSGVPANLGTFPITITATNSTGSDTHALSLTVQAPPPVVTSAASANAHTHTPFSFAVIATNDAASYSATGLPDGLSLDPATGIISGTPSVAGTYTIQITATNASGAITQPFVLTIAPPPNAPVYTGDPMPSGVQGVTFLFTPDFGSVTAPYSVAGPLPAGLSFTATSGVISGVPSETGAFPIKLSATNAAGTTTIDLTIVINPAPAAPVITSASLAPLARKGVPFTFTLTSTGTPPASTYAATGLPAGLTLDATTGVISGTPMEFGNHQVGVRATNSAGTGPKAVLAIAIAPAVDAPVISGAPVAVGRVGQAFTYTLAASNGPTGFAVTSGTLPSGLQLAAATGAITGTPDAAALGDTRVWFNATNVAGAGLSMEVLFRIAPASAAPIVTSNGTANARVGQPFQYVISTLSETAVTGHGAAGLPPWLSLDPATGVLSGVPAEPSAEPLEIWLTATNATAISNPKLVRLTVMPALGTPEVTSPLKATGRAGVTFTYQLTASNSPTSFVATGLPAGLLLDATTGAITGTPSLAGRFDVVLRAGNTSGLGQGVTMRLGITPALETPAITSSATATGQVGMAFSYQTLASNGPILSYGLRGTLPVGLVFNSTTGEISGQPVDDPRTYSVELTATNVAGTGAPQSLLIRITPMVGVPVLTTAEYAFGRVGEQFSFTITATNLTGVAPYAPPIVLDAVNLPAGLAVNPATGVVEGMPTQVGTTVSTLTAANAAGSGAARDLSIIIRPAANAPKIQYAGTAAAQVGQAFSYQITATNSPQIYEVLDAPEWMRINSSTGMITGLPDAPGACAVRLVAINAAGSSAATPLHIMIAAAANTPVVTSSRTHTGTVGTAMSFTIAASPAAPPVTFLATGLPPGLALDPATGVVSGTPIESGTFEMLVTPSSSHGVGTPVTLTLTIRPNVVFGS